MIRTLRQRAEDAAQEVQKILGVAPDDHPKEVADAVEQSIIRALVAERDRCAEVARVYHKNDAPKGKELSDKISLVRSVLVSNLSAMR